MKRFQQDWEYLSELPNQTFRKQGNSCKKYYLNKTKLRPPGMLFENFDKKIREAAERHHPAYDENAWARMEKLLDREMPLKENRRRRFLMILFLLAGLGIAGLLIVQPWKKSSEELVAKENITAPGNKLLPSQPLQENPVQKEITPSAAVTGEVSNPQTEASATFKKDQPIVQSRKR